jgi:hypothetical protein
VLHDAGDGVPSRKKKKFDIPLGVGRLEIVPLKNLHPKAGSGRWMRV